MASPRRRARNREWRGFRRIPHRPRPTPVGSAPLRPMLKETWRRPPAGHPLATRGVDGQHAIQLGRHLLVQIPWSRPNPGPGSEAAIVYSAAFMSSLEWYLMTFGEQMSRTTMEDPDGGAHQLAGERSCPPSPFQPRAGTLLHGLCMFQRPRDEPRQMKEPPGRTVPVALESTSMVHERTTLTGWRERAATGQHGARWPSRRALSACPIAGIDVWRRAGGQWRREEVA